MLVPLLGQGSAKAGEGCQAVQEVAQRVLAQPWPERFVVAARTRYAA